LLGINTRVAHFVKNHPKTCTFCDLTKKNEDTRETFLHLFFECSIVENVLIKFYSWLCGTEQFDIGRRDFFLGFEIEDLNKKIVLDILMCLVKKFIWDCKLRFTLPTFDLLRDFCNTEVKHFKRVSKNFASTLEKTTLRALFL
jgi:hypothetical protein